VAVEGEAISVLRTPAGIPVVVEEQPGSRSAAISVFVRAGSRDEPAEMSGAAHLLEHMLFRGTQRRSSRQLSEDVESAGGEMNGFTSKEVTCYYTIGLRDTFSEVSDVLSDVVINPLLDEGALRLEKMIVSQEVAMLVNEPELYIHSLVNLTMWEGHPISRPEVGDLDNLRSMTTESLRQFYRDRYSRQRIVVVACGAVSPERVLEWSRETMDLLEPEGGKMSREPPESRAGLKVYERAGEQTYVGMAFPAYHASHRSRYAEKVLETILGSGMSSRLFQRVREEEGLVYSIYTHASFFSDCGNLGVFFSTGEEETGTVLKVVAEEIARLKREGLKEGELLRAKRLSHGEFVRKLESTDQRLFRLGGLYSLTGRAPTVEETVRELEAVDEEEVMSVAEELLVPSRMCLSVYARKDVGERIEWSSLDF